MLLLYSSLIICFFINLFVNLPELNYLIGVLAILCFIFSYKGANSLFRNVGTIFILIGIFCFIYLDKPLYELPTYMTSTVTILAIFFVLPFINSIIVVGRYDQNVNKILKARVEHLGQLYYRGSLVSFILGTFLNIATLPLVEAVLRKNLKDKTKKLRDKFITRAMLRGYGLSLAWSPMEILVAISIEITATSYLPLLPWLLGFSIFLLFVDWILGYRFRTEPVDQHHYLPSVNTKDILKKIGVLFLYLIVFILLVVIVRKGLNIGFLSAVTLVIIPYSFLWAVMIHRFKSYLSYSIPIWKERTKALKSYMVLFIAVGFFTTMLNQTSFITYVQKPFEVMATNPLLLFVSIQVMFLGLAMVGFHPLVTISILGSILQPILTVINPESIAIVLITSGLSTTAAGPYNVTVSLTGSLLHENPYQISIWNLGYAFLFSSTGTAIAMFLL